MLTFVFYFAKTSKGSVRKKGCVVIRMGCC